MKRRKFLASSTGILSTGIVGCVSSFSESDPDPTFEAEVVSKVLFGEPGPDLQADRERVSLLIITRDEATLDRSIKQHTDLTDDDIDLNTRLDELPMGEIYGAVGIQWTFVEVDIRLLTRDRVNNVDPTEEGVGRPYTAPTEFFDQLQVGERYELQVARSADSSFPEGRLRQRIINIVE